MKLDKKERLMLVNQFLILEKLYPEEADYYVKHRRALSEGYELHYDWIYEHLFDGLNEEQCKMVLDILDMYSGLHFASEKSTNEEFTKHIWLKFKGFDGNNESAYMGYSRYFMVDLGRFDELHYGKKYPDLNSHMPTIPKYKAMLEVWKKEEKPFEMSDEQAIAILEADPHA